MTRGQIAQLHDLSKCWCLPRKDWNFVLNWLNPFWVDRDEPMGKWSKRNLRRLTHQYRNQIAAIKRNQAA